MTRHRNIAATALLGFAAFVTECVVASLPESAESARCEIWARELSFADAVARHDATAFAQHLHPQAAFGVGRKPTVGRDAIVAEWRGIIDGSAMKLQWYPDVVTVGGDGRTAYSSGPALFQEPKTGDYRRSRFASVWQRGEDGQWQVIFDDGSPPEPVDQAAVDAFSAGRTQACPTS